MQTPEQSPQHLTVADCARWATVSERTVRAWLRAPEGTPEHLPSVMATRKGSQRAGRSHYSVQAGDLEALLARITAPAPLPSDAITPGRAAAMLAELLAGKPMKARATLERCVERLAREADRGRLTRYIIAGQRRYSEVEVEALAPELAAEGVGWGALDRRAARSSRIERERRDGEVTVAEAAERCNVRPATARGWARDGLYGARQSPGQWYFDAEKLPAPRKPRAAQQDKVTVVCDECGDDLGERYASEARRSRHFCEGCLPVVREREGWSRGPRNISPEARARMTAKRGRIRVTDEERARRSERALAHNRELSKSTTRHPARVAKMMRTRYGRELTEEEIRRHAGRALSRAQLGSPRSQNTRELENRVRELWALDFTAEQIADQLRAENWGRITSRYIWKMRERLGLPRRKPGRRPANS